MSQLFFLLILVNVIGFSLAFLLRNKEFSTSWYDSIKAFTASMMFGIIVFDFMPHLLNEFLGGHHENHKHYELEISGVSSLKIGLFLFLILAGYAIQTMLERAINHSFTHKLENFALIFGMFIHSFTEVSVLFDEQQHINRSLLVGIIIHSLPLAFIVSYTLLGKTKKQYALYWFLLYLLAIPLGLFSNKLALHLPELFLYVSVFISGLMLHVIWHLWESVKEKSWLNYGLLIFGIGSGYLVTYATAIFWE